MSTDGAKGYNKKSVTDIDVAGKKVLLRCDFNVPIDKETGKIRDEGRIIAALPTINYLLDKSAAIIACSHFGRPKGEFKPEFSLAQVAESLSKHLGKPVKMAKDVVGPDATSLAAELKPGEIMLLENTRFHAEEEKNNPDFAKKLADMADVFVSDAFGSVHRAHASTEGVSHYLPAVSGFLLKKELDHIGGAISDPKRPLVAILGGAKVSDKLGVIKNLLKISDAIIIGGGMAYTFFKAEGGKIGNSLCEDSEFESVLSCKKEAEERGVKLLLPEDSVAGAEFSNDVEAKTFDSDAIPDGMMAMDIGPKAIAAFTKEISCAGTIVWNGPMGVFEFSKFAEGTKAVSEAVAGCGAISVIGGGDSAAAVRKFGVADKITHISTGGGASLEFMEGKVLPGIACLLDA
ncbi:MAG: phosphoglycerate kinase [Oscillospiraceae bacterium]|nr:phosphoglycerate kinase [Oscillospiraceae bacterium]MCL2278020.1 phosphoglycerate kinase [Oscillospiraceae bacterium]